MKTKSTLLVLSLSLVTTLYLVRIFTRSPEHDSGTLYKQIPVLQSDEHAKENTPMAGIIDLFHLQTKKLTNSTSSKTSVTPTVEDTSPQQGLGKFPYYTWEQKLSMYYAGKPPETTRYPDGLEYHGITQLSDNVFAIDKDRFTAQSKSEDLLSHAHIDDHEPGIIRVTEVVPGGIFDRLGLLPNDQFLAINGNAITSYAELYSIYQGMQGGSQVTLQLLRNGEVVDFTYFVQ